MIMKNQIEFSHLDQMDKFYDPAFVDDTKVREAWFVFCYYFLPKVNKTWKESLQKSRLKKTTCIFTSITTSDEALVKWFVQLWKPKLEEDERNGWPKQSNKFGEGEHEIKTRLREYILIHQSISNSRAGNNLQNGLQWDAVFWEEVKKRFPSVFQEKFAKSSNALIGNENEDGFSLPGLDNIYDYNGALDDFKKKGSSMQQSQKKILQKKITI